MSGTCIVFGRTRGYVQTSDHVISISRYLVVGR